MSKDKKLEQILDLVGEYAKEKVNEKNKFIPGETWIKFSGPVFSEVEYKEIVKSVLDGWFIFGQKARKFEKLLADYMGVKYATLTNSGSSANLLAVSALTSPNTKYNLRGSKAIVCACAFPTSINPIIQLGLKPIFVDCERGSGNINLDAVEERIKFEGEDVRVIMFAHTLGLPVNMDRLQKIIKKYDLIFIEDACDALGSTYNGKKLGTFGIMGTVSFFPAHHITMMEGGVVLTDDLELKLLLDSHRDWGRSCVCAGLGDVTEYGKNACMNRFQKWFKNSDIIYDHRYVFSEIGFNLKPLDIQAACGIVQLKKIGEFEKIRKENFDKYYNFFKKYEKYFVLPSSPSSADISWFGFPLIVKDNKYFTRIDFIQHLEFKKIQTRMIFAGNILRHKAYKKYSREYDMESDFPNADNIMKNGFYLGTYAGITQEKLDYIFQIVSDFFSERIK